MMRRILTFLLFALTAPLLWAVRPLNIYFIDVEGGQATLIVAPSGDSMLVDAGWPNHNFRDAGRIAAAAKKARVKKIDYFLLTHYHADHVGGVPNLITRLPVETFFDHGPDTETDKQAVKLSQAYAAAVGKSNHVVVKPGSIIPLRGVTVQIVAAAEATIDAPLPGAGQPNPDCASAKPKLTDRTENAQSVGFVLTYGKFRFVDLGDLTWNKELQLVCPANKIGTADVYLVTHHGSNLSNGPAIVHAIHPRVAIMDNGARKGGSAEAWQTVHDSPGLEDLWQLHFAVAGEKEHNSPDPFIANVDEQCSGEYLKLVALPSGEFTVYNSRNRYERTYR